VEDESGWTPLHLACKLGHDKIAMLLVDKAKSELLITSVNDNLPIHLVLDSKEEKLDLAIKILEKIKKEKNFYLFHTILYKVNSNKRSILQIAMERGHLNIVEQILINYYPDLNLPDG
jgi:ankyrin repeat protein